NDIRAACRLSISGETIKFRDAFWADRDVAICPVSGKSMTRWNSDVDHYPVKFRDIIQQFLDTDIGKTLTYDKLIVSQDNVQGVLFADKELEKEWQEFHNKKAGLRVVEAYTNRYVLR